MDAPTKKKGILVIHGMGSQQKGATLRGVVTPLINFLWYRGRSEPVLEADFDLDGKRPASIGVRYEAYDLKFVEVLWANSVEAPAFDPMIGWTLRRMGRHLLGLLLLVLFSVLLPASILVLVLILGMVSLLLIVGMAVYTLPGYVLAVIFGLVRSAVPRRLGGRAFRWPQGFLLNAFANYVGSIRTFLAYVAAPFSKERRESIVFSMQQSQSFLEDPLKATLRQLEHMRYSILNDDVDFLTDALDATGWKRLGKLVLVFVAAVFQLLNSMFVLIMYMGAAILVVVLMFVLFALTRLMIIPGTPKAVLVIKGVLDRFLVGSLGDVRVFLDDPIQAERIREELRAGCQLLLDKGYDDLYVVAHSTGAAIAYETLTVEASQEVACHVRKLITAGSIMSMVWQYEQRSSFRKPLKQPWINFWSRYDPALAGPIRKRYEEKTGCERVEDVPVTNEEDPLTDHSTYWENYPQVVARIVEELFDEEGSEFKRTDDERREDSLRRKRSVLLLLAWPRLISAWLPWPTFLGVFFFRSNWAGGVISGVDRVASLVGWESFGMSALLDPQGRDERFMLAVVATFVIGGLGYLIYGFYRALWEAPAVGPSRIERRLIEVEES